MIGLQSGPTVMMTLGGYKFGISTAAYQELTRITEWRWPVQERFMQGQALQYVGPGGDTITLPGVIYPEYRGGFGQLNSMRITANNGQPLTLISGDGVVMGRWVIERLEEKQMVFGANGHPRKQEFTLNLRKFDDANQGNVTTPLGGDFVSAATAASDIEGILSAIDKAQSLAGSYSGQIGRIADSISSSRDAVQGYAGILGADGGVVLQQMSRGQWTADILKDALLVAYPSGTTSQTILSNMIAAAKTSLQNSGAAGSAINKSYQNLVALGTVSDEALLAVQTGMADVNRLTATSTLLQNSASAQLSSIG